MSAARPLHIISLGAGVQSTTLALMAAHGEITPMPDAAIFADTGAEPAAVYRHLHWLRSPNVLPFPVEVVSSGNIVEDTIAASMGGTHAKGSGPTAPFFVEAKDGRAAPLRRQCTDAYKIAPINRRLRKKLGLTPGQRMPAGVEPVCLWIGISLDEVQRMKPAKERWIERRWPLLEKRMTRGDCQEWLKRMGYGAAPRSARTICPYRRDAEWRQLRRDDAVGFAEAVTIDQIIRPGFKSRKSNDRRTGKLYLHRSMKPLDRVDLRTDEEAGQPDLWSGECEGMCGV